MKKTLIVLLVSCLILAAFSYSSAQDATQWSKTRKFFLQKRKSSNHDLREKAVERLNAAVYPAVESEAAELLSEQIKLEVKRSRGAIDKESLIRYQVIKACMSGMEKFTEQKAINYLLKVAEDKKTDWRTKFHIIYALSSIENTKIISVMLKFIQDDSIPIRSAAFRSLARFKVPDAIEQAYETLSADVTWELKIAVVEYLEKMQNEEMVEPLIKVIQDVNLEGSVRIRIISLLKTLTGVDCGISGQWWQEWFDKKKESEDPNYKPDPNKTEPFIPTLYYGITVTSGRIIFILDISDSMSQAANYTDFSEHVTDPYNIKITGAEEENKEDSKALKKLRELKAQWDKKAVVNRFDAAIKELINTIYYLDPMVEFTVIFFDVAQRQWQDTLLPATVQNKISVLEYIDARIGIGAGTGFYDALELAYKFIGKEKKVKKVKSGYDKPGDKPERKFRAVQLVRTCNYLNEFGGADTFFMVTDGAPTYGKIIDKDSILNEIEKINLFRGVKINVVAIGEPPLNPLAINPRMDVDAKFLGKLADLTGGVFKDKTSKKKRGEKRK